MRRRLSLMAMAAAMSGPAESAPATGETPLPSVLDGAVEDRLWHAVQTGSFESLADAEALRTRLLETGYAPVSIEAVAGRHRVLFGPVRLCVDALLHRDDLRASGLAPGAFLRTRPAGTGASPELTRGYGRPPGRRTRTSWTECRRTRTTPAYRTLRTEWNTIRRGGLEGNEVIDRCRF